VNSILSGSSSDERPLPVLHARMLLRKTDQYPGSKDYWTKQTTHFRHILSVPPGSRNRSEHELISHHSSRWIHKFLHASCKNSSICRKPFELHHLPRREETGFTEDVTTGRNLPLDIRGLLKVLALSI